MIYRYIILCVILFMSGVLLVGCGNEIETESPMGTIVSTEEDEILSETSIKVVHFVNGGLGDNSIFDSAERGLREAEADFDYLVNTIEVGHDPALWESAFYDTVANQDYDVMIVGSPPMAELLQNAAPRYPDKKFIIYDVSVNYQECDCENVYSVRYSQNEGSYLAGLYAGLMTQLDMKGMNDDLFVGVVGGLDIPVINDFIIGYKQGASDAGLDPINGVIVQYAGSFKDPAKGKEIALTMYEQGADIVFNVAGGTGMGIFQAAEEAGHYAIGVDTDQAVHLAKTDPGKADHILTSMMKNVDFSMYRALELFSEGNLPFGTFEILGVADGGVGLAYNEYFYLYTPPDIVDKVKQAEQDLLSGKIEVNTVLK